MAAGRMPATLIDELDLRDNPSAREVAATELGRRAALIDRIARGQTIGTLTSLLRTYNFLTSNPDYLSGMDSRYEAAQILNLFEAKLIVWDPGLGRYRANIRQQPEFSVIARDRDLAYRFSTAFAEKDDELDNGELFDISLISVPVILDLLGVVAASIPSAARRLLRGGGTRRLLAAELELGTEAAENYASAGLGGGARPIPTGHQPGRPSNADRGIVTERGEQLHGRSERPVSGRPTRGPGYESQPREGPNEIVLGPPASPTLRPIVIQGREMPPFEATPTRYRWVNRLFRGTGGKSPSANYIAATLSSDGILSLNYRASARSAAGRRRMRPGFLMMQDVWSHFGSDRIRRVIGEWASERTWSTNYVEFVRVLAGRTDAASISEAAFSTPMGQFLRWKGFTTAELVGEIPTAAGAVGTQLHSVTIHINFGRPQ